MTEEVVDMEQLPADEPVSMEDTIRETYRKITSGEESEQEKADRIRDERGRFASKTETESIAVTQVDTPPEPVVSRKPPSSWKKEAQDLYGKLPQEYQLLQDEIERREADFHKGIEGYRAKAQFAEAMERVIAPHMQTIQSLGVTPDVAVRELLKADQVLRYSEPEQKRAYFNQLAKSYGIDLQQQAGEYQLQPMTNDPRVDSVINYLRQQEQARQQQELSALNSEIVKFSEGKEHFEAVRNHMAGLLQSGVATTLQEAYEMAIYADPNIRSQLLAKQHEEAEQKRQAEAKAQAEAARKAASVNVSRRGSMPVSKPKGSMDDTIRAEAARLGLL